MVHEGGEGVMVPGSVLVQEFGQLARGCGGFGLGFGVVDVDTGGLEFFGGRVSQ
ncbi:hypothetical protein ACFRI7_06660 [Streptomyces sp. NPDC056716]|uniref:hypothetical protein n=1 Tax=unclassified Streptomyces TaxID=2593676 RepID=UPI0036921B52